ncbi:hypothetical protein GW17_00023171 [Ensete ventricosum]|nr:hypothetical protein GW17_00023171 [Ensete ventricosum]
MRTSRGGDLFATVISSSPSRLRRRGKEGSISDFCSSTRGGEALVTSYPRGVKTTRRRCLVDFLSLYGMVRLYHTIPNFARYAGVVLEIWATIVVFTTTMLISKTARYRAVPPKIDCWWSISTVYGRLREKSTVGGRLRKKKGRRRGKEEKKKRRRKNTSPARHPRPRAVLARGSPARRRRPRVARAHSRFFSREETKCLPTQGERSRRHDYSSTSIDVVVMNTLSMMTDL